MEQITFRKIALIILCLCLTVFIAACGSSVDKQTVSSESENKAGKTVTEEADAAADEAQPEKSEETNTESILNQNTPSADAPSADTENARPSQQPVQQQAAPQQTASQQNASQSKQPAAQSNSKESPQEQAQREDRIIATSAAVCDITDRLGIDLVGVPETSVTAIAARYENVKRIGSPMEPDMEIIKSLKPTDVIGPDTLKEDLEIKYNNIGVTSTFVDLRSVQGLYNSVRLIGDKYGKSAEADRIIAEYTGFMAEYSGSHKGMKSPKVLVLMGLPGSYLVATQKSYAGSLVELAGGTNVFHHNVKDFLSVNPEEILATDPDVIIRTAHGLPKEALEMFEKEFSQNSIWKHFRAVKEGRVYDVDYMLFGMSATFDYPQALAELEPMLYGE